MVHGAAVWCLNPAVHMARKLSSIQRSFLLAISGAYRTTPSAALQIILGIPPLHLQLQTDARMTVLYKLRRQINGIIIQPDDLERRNVGWSTHPSNYLTQEQLQLEDGDNGNNHTRLFTDSSKTPNSVGAAFCAMEDGVITHRWSTKLRDENTVFQAKLLALKEAIQYATYITSHQPIKILTDNTASIQASSNPKTHNATGLQVFETLLEHPQIELQWIKAHAGYLGKKKQQTN
ncbi:hypothetical protein AVEN_272273-1 [Araneus ventricosus]|uniref:RNase H type-1 domain-containing protein n=1 Tax=Araneus ventricosus TaxID=182803 RepID=A0A4Y2SLP5_ARAVE|nr:hypothetical protein AVEN_272273-1 [Araneus ventricosus]